ncbi:MG2 domain-containing protein [Vampirovibrio chlorellavorus]|uniref:alpha-2-macroglobulin family protein n=1 Tax=Vampirovibrio chlorellavorus TaxID=758823 RepID=UPI0026ED8F89|nr:MG2 domain-containing protein [Vampirovibrio chlorellavorus]
MFTNKPNQSVLLSVSVVALLFAGGAIAIGLEKPTGSLAGKIDLEQEGFQLSSYDIKGNKVYALAVGPRGGTLVERGVWVKPDGTFKINQLPVGEYSLTVRAPGFSTTDEQGLFVDEAKTTQLKDAVHLAILEPSVNIASNTRVFTGKEVPHFWLNAMGSDQATVRIYRKDMLSLLQNSRQNGMDFSADLSLYKPYQKNSGVLFKNETPLKTLSRKLERDYQDWSHAEFKLNEPLPPGEYLLVAEVSNLKQKSDWNVMWFSVSNLGLIVKQAVDQTWVRAIDLNTLQPVPNAQIQLLDRDHPQLARLGQGKTNAQGIASFPVPNARKRESNYNWLAIGTQAKNRAFGGIGFWNDARDNYSTYFYTERPIYRLGQTVYFKGISRLKTASGFQTPKAGMSLGLRIEDPDNTKLWEGRVNTNDHGTFHGLYQVPKDGKTGAYQLTITYPDGSESYERFEVAQYRKPEYQVDVLPLQPRLVAGDRAEARIRANYYFGAPVTNARVKYTVYASTDWSSRFGLMPRPDYYGYFDDWDNDDGVFEDLSYAGDYITEGFAQTDATGEALIDFPTQPMKIDPNEPYSLDYLDRRYTIQAEVTDLSRMAVVGSGSQSVVAGDFTLFVQPKQSVTRAGEPVQAELNAVYYNGQPVAHRAISVSLMRWNWDRVKQEYRGTSVLGTVSATTNAQGKAAVTLPTTDQYFSDNYYLTARASDDHGHTIYDQSSLWIASPNQPYVREGQQAQQEAFSLKLDKKIYQPGEVAKALITAPVSGKEKGQAIVAVEGSKIHTLQVVPMDATAKVVEIPLSGDYAPNVYVTATFVGPKHQFYNQSEMAMVSPAQHFLNLTVTPDKARYQPGEKATYTITAKYPNGQPAPNTEVSLGVVDESIYAIRPDAAEDIRKFFYPRIYNSVLTLSSFPEEYSAGPDKIEPKVRKDFRDVAGWQPVLKTDAQGLAKATIQLPDNLTTWRATVRGITAQTDVGAALSKVIATQDLIVRLALPRFYTQHDQARLTAIVHNYTQQPQTVALTLNPSSQFETRQALSQKLTIQADKASRYEWPVTIKTPGQGTVAIKAVGQTAGDALELQVPIHPLGVEVSEAHSGQLPKPVEAVEIPLKLPPNTDPRLAQVILSVAGSTIGPVLGSFDSLIDYPYGCTEQTMSRLVPSMVAVQLSQQLNLPLSQAQQEKFRQVSLKALGKLKDAHNPDGGWGWWQYGESDPAMTAYVMEGLATLKQLNMPVDWHILPDQWQADGLKWMQAKAKKLAHQLADPKLASERILQAERFTDLAYLQQVLALYGQKTDAQTRQFVLSQVPKATPEALSYLTLAFVKQQDTAAALQSFAALNRLADHSADTMSWDHTAPMGKKLGFDSADYTYRFTGTEATALGLRATLAMRPYATVAPDTLAAIERWLMLQRGKDGWDNTKTTALVLKALLEKTLALRSNQPPNFTATSNLWTEARAFTQAQLYDPEFTTRVALAQQHPTFISLRKEGPGELFYSTVLTYWQALQPGAQVPQVAMPQGLSIQRKFFRIQAEPVGPNGTMRFKMYPLSGNQVRAGETVLMKVTVNTPVALPYVLLEAALPSGGEVISNDPRESLLQESDEEGQFSGDWGNWWWAHQDILDDRVVMFANSVPAGKSEFHALVRMELPGTFQMNPVKLEGMYSQRVKAYSALDSIQVVE